MKIIERTQDRLILRRKDWVTIVFFVIFTLIWLCGFVVVLIREPGNILTLGICASVAVTSAAALWAGWCDITVCFDKAANQISVQRRRFRGTSHTIYKLSDLSAITYDTDIDSDLAKMQFTFGPDTTPLVLPARQNKLFRPYNSYVEKLIEDIGDWSGRVLIQPQQRKPSAFI